MHDNFVKTNANMSVTVDQAALQNVISSEARKAALKAVENIIYENFRHEGYFDEKPGAAYMLCVEAVENYVLSEEFQEVLSRMIRHHVEQAASEAILTLLKSKSRKALFTLAES